MCGHKPDRASGAPVGGRGASSPQGAGLPAHADWVKWRDDGTQGAPGQLWEEKASSTPGVAVAKKERLKAFLRPTTLKKALCL